MFSGQIIIFVTSIQQPPLLSGLGHLLDATSQVKYLCIYFFFTFVKQPANYLFKGSGDNYDKELEEPSIKTLTEAVGITSQL